MASGYSDLSEIRKDSRNFGAYPKPPKINLLNEQPRRESLVEQQLTSQIVRPQMGQNPVATQIGYNQQQVYTQRSQAPNANLTSFSNASSSYSNAIDTGYLQYPAANSHVYSSASIPSTRTLTTSCTTFTANQPSAHVDLEIDLFEKEAKLKRELAYSNQHQNQWSRPPQVREPRREPQAGIRKDPRWVREYPSSPSSRPASQASSTKSTTEADLLEKAEKLLRDVEEIERKPLHSQQMLIESGARPRQSESSLNLDQGVSSIQSTVIKVPRGEINNRSPLPFAFDNFSTLGVRGNIASVGAAEPDAPYPPIFPQIKRTPSPTNQRRY